MSSLYVCLFSNGHLKVGRSSTPWRSVRKAMGPLESPKSESPMRKQRAF